MTATTKPARKTAAKPRTAKPPQDHKPKAPEKPKVEAIDGGRRVVHKGITVEVLDTALGDYDTVDDLAVLQEVYNLGDNAPKELQNQVAFRLPRVIRRLFGTDGAARMTAQLRAQHDGQLPVEIVAEYLTDVLGALGNS